jgi:hypothetical protein
MKKRFNLLLLAGLLALAALSANLLAGTANADPFAGTWVMNAGKSIYPPGMAPKSMTIVMEPAGNGIHYRSESTFANGISTTASYTADYNGREVMVTGSRGMLLPVSLKRTDARTVTASYLRGMQVVATSVRAISEDGQVMTITTASRNAKDENVTAVGVYEKSN